MPRVNKDLERRMAARRERDRRRPPLDKRYRFAPSPGREEVDAGSEAQAPAAEVHPAAPAAAAQGRPATRGVAPRAPRVAPRTFASYREEYGYVIRDLRRIAVVVAILTVILLVLWLLLGGGG